jgi:hypothetical protein
VVEECCARAGVATIIEGGAVDAAARWSTIPDTNVGAHFDIAS